MSKTEAEATPKPLTDSQARALRIVADHSGRAHGGGLRPREFAMLMWPDSPGWGHSTKSGPKGAHKGGGMYLAGGGYMGKLDRLGYIGRTYAYRFDTGYVITALGRKMLDAYEKEHADG